MNWKEVILSISIGILLSIPAPFLVTKVLIPSDFDPYYNFYVIVFSILPSAQFFIISMVLKNKFRSDWLKLKNQIILFIVSFLTFSYGHNFPLILSSSVQISNFLLILSPVILIFGFVFGIMGFVTQISSRYSIPIGINVSIFFCILSSIGLSYFLTKDIKDRKFRYKLIILFLIFSFIELLGVLGFAALRY